MNFEIPIDGDNKEKEEKKKESYDNDSNKNLKRGLTSSWGRGGNNTSKIIEQRRAPCWKKFTWFEFRVNSRNRTSRREEETWKNSWTRQAGPRFGKGQGDEVRSERIVNCLKTIRSFRANHCQLFLFIPFFYLFTYLFLCFSSSFLASSLLSFFPPPRYLL